jgi:melibiase-like protein
MDRRTFILFTGTASLTWAAGPRNGADRLVPTAVGQLRISLAPDRRWSLSYLGGAAPVPLIPATPLAIRIGDRQYTLAELEDIAVATARPPVGGRSTVLRGRGGGAFVEAEFWTGAPGAVPVASVSVRVYPDAQAPAVTRVDFADVPVGRTLGASGDLTALLSGYQSASPSRVEVLSPAEDAGEAESHFFMGLARRTRALALAFEAGDSGEGRFAAAAGRLVATSEILPPRPTPPGSERAILHIAYSPGADPVTALDAVLAPTSEADRERLAAAVVPAGWCSWYGLKGGVTQDDMVANLDLAARHFDPRYLRFIQLDDGYQRAAGDWEMNAKFPNGHRWLTDQIKAKGFRAGLWVAPFAVSERSGLAETHRDWLVTDESGTPLLIDTRDDWGGRIYGLDPAHPDAQEWLRALGSRVIHEWGYEYVKVDALSYATRGERHHGGATHADAYRAGLRAIRDGLGPDAFLLAARAPLQHAVGLVDGMRIGPDVENSWSGVQEPARAAALRAPLHRALWLNDPDCLLVRPPLTEDEARAWASVVAASGGMTLFSDNLPALPAERIEILQRTLPVSPVAGRPLPLTGGDPNATPGLWLTAGRPDWWTLVAVNWGEEPVRLDLLLRQLGITAPTVLAYDAWRGEFDGPVSTRWRSEVPPHACRVTAFRPRRIHPQVLGTSRHIIQGAVDIADEVWTPRGRTLTVKSINLDRRPYDVTLAVPGSYRAAEVLAPVAAKLWRDAAGVVRVTLEPGEAGEIEWSVRFTSVRSAGSRG